MGLCCGKATGREAPSAGAPLIEIHTPSGALLSRKQEDEMARQQDSEQSLELPLTLIDDSLALSVSRASTEESEPFTPIESPEAQKKGLTEEEKAARAAHGDIGCYLMWTQSDQGTLLMHWSKDKMKDALAAFYPGRADKIPKHRYTSNQGRQVIFHQANLGIHKHKYFEGYCTFVKTAQHLNSLLVVWSDVVVPCIHFEGELIVLPTLSEELDLEPADAVAVVSKNNASFAGVRTMIKNDFMRRAAMEGHGMLLGESDNLRLSASLNASQTLSLKSSLNASTNLNASASSTLRTSQTSTSSSRARSNSPHWGPLKADMAAASASHALGSSAGSSEPSRGSTVLTEEQKSSRAAHGDTGCYLVWSESDHGTLLMHWSHSKIDDALAVFYPGKQVPNYRFSSNQGRTVILQQVETAKNKYYEGWCQFVKTAKSLDSLLLIWSDKVVLHLHIGGKESVTEAAHLEEMDLNTVDAIAVVPSTSKVFAGVQTLRKTEFLDMALKEAFGISL